MSRDVYFTPHGCYRGYGAAVARSAVLYSLTGVPTFNAKARDEYESTVAASSISVLIKWRYLLDALSTHGWHGNSDESYLRNCSSAFVLARPLTRQCKHRQICPHCYARQVSDIWSAIDAAMPNDRHDGLPVDLAELDDITGPLDQRQYPFHLLERRSESFVPLTASESHWQIAANPEQYRYIEKHAFDRAPRDPLEVSACTAYLREFLQRVPRARTNMMREVGAVGGYATVVVEPWGECWHVEHRSLMIIPAASNLDLLLPRPNTGAMTRHVCPTRRTIADAVVRTCTYPKRWMVGDPSLTSILLHARQSLRLSACYGIMRKRGSDEVE